MTKFNLTTIGFAALLATGCGSDENPTNSSKENIPSTPASAFDSLIVQSAANLPACDAGREGRAFFVQNENLPRLCVKGIWRSAADTTDFSITCSNGILHAVDKVTSQSNGTTIGSRDTKGIARKCEQCT